jgi:hypothetical protein
MELLYSFDGNGRVPKVGECKKVNLLPGEERRPSEAAHVEWVL